MLQYELFQLCDDTDCKQVLYLPCDMEFFLLLLFCHSTLAVWLSAILSNPIYVYDAAVLLFVCFVFCSSFVCVLHFSFFAFHKKHIKL